MFPEITKQSVFIMQIWKLNDFKLVVYILYVNFEPILGLVQALDLG